MNEDENGFSEIVEDHKLEQLFSDRLINGRPKKFLSNWPPNEDVQAQVERAMEIFTKNLSNHFSTEEEIIFNKMNRTVRGEGIRPLLEMLKKQHIELKQLFSNLKLNKYSDSDLRDKLHEIGLLLRYHIEIEENQIFPIFKQALERQQIDEIAEELKIRNKFDILSLL